MSRRVLAVIASAFVAGTVAASVTLMQSPGQQRLRRADEVRVEDLQILRDAVRDFARDAGTLPGDLDALAARRSVPPRRLRDPLGGTPYVYRIVDPEHFELCATFALDARERNLRGPRQYPGPGEDTELWGHGAGEQCFRFPLEPPGQKN